MDDHLSLFNARVKDFFKLTAWKNWDLGYLEKLALQITIVFNASWNEQQECVKASQLFDQLYEFSGP